jgi:hypothetical protein
VLEPGLTICFANRTFCNKSGRPVAAHARAPVHRQKIGSVMASLKRLVEERW